MKVNFYATLRAIVGQKTVEIETEPNPTAYQIAMKVVEAYPDLRRELFDAQGQFQGHIKFFINGRDISFLENKIETVIQPDDKIDIFPPVGGG